MLKAAHLLKVLKVLKVLKDKIMPRVKNNGALITRMAKPQAKAKTLIAQMKP